MIFVQKYLLFGTHIKMSGMSHIQLRVNTLHPFSETEVLEAFSDLQPLSLKIPSHFSVELNLSLKLWRQADESHKCLEHHTSKYTMKYGH